MREHLFRGQSVGDLKPWIFGYYHFDKSLNAHYICDADTLVRYEVRPETVGQYCGLDDIAGNKIFEDDVVMCGRSKKAPLAVICFEEQAFLQQYLPIEKKREDNVYDYMENYPFFKIVGNRIDNPELLDQ